jgi:hypothetical protein
MLLCTIGWVLLSPGFVLLCARSRTKQLPGSASDLVTVIV